MALTDVSISRGRPRMGLRRSAQLVLLLVGVTASLTLILAAPPVHLFTSNELREGDVTSQNIRAPKRVQYVSSIETRIERDRAVNSVQEVFVFDPGVAPQQRNKLASTLQTIGATRATPNLTPDAKKAAIKKALEFDVPDVDLSLMVQMDDVRWQLFSTNATRVLYEVLSERVPVERLRDLPKDVASRLASIPNDDDRTLAGKLVNDFARVNYAPNPTETARLRRDAQDAVPPVVKTVERGEIVLREGDVVRGTDLEKLEALGLRSPIVDWHAITSSALLAILVVALLAGYIWLFEPWLLSHERRIVLIALIMLATALAAKQLLSGRPNGIYAFPLASVAMLLTTLIDAQLAMLVTVLLGFLVAIITGSTVEIALIGVVGAVLGALGVRRNERLYSYFAAGLLVAVGNFAVIVAFRLMAKDDDWAGLAVAGGLCLVNGLLAASLTVGTFSLLGRLFGITTTMQLLELSDPTQPLLRRLLNEAPGTYHHSIMVGNLAERAAERVGADPLLVRVGAYYHDIGKLARPYFFIENQFDGVNVHDSLDFQTSARIVASHVQDGIDLAQKYRLPPRVREFISEHHGTRLVTYFYNRARQGDGQVDASQYVYPGPKPGSKEAGIVMLADSVEAVVRSAKDHSPESVAVIVRKVVDERMAEGQLDECDLTIRDVEEIKKAFTAILMGMYHPRIEYPPSTSLVSSRSPETDEERASVWRRHTRQPAPSESTPASLKDEGTSHLERGATTDEGATT